MDGMEKEFITIRKFARLLDAYSVASRIESEGIECFLPDERFAKSSHNHFIGASEIKLQVRKENVTRARRILNKEPFNTFDDMPTG